MEIKRDIRRLLGLPEDSSRSEVVRRCEELLRWLESRKVPQEMASWSVAQRDLLREIYERASAEMVEEDAEDVGWNEGDATVVVADRARRAGVLASTASWLGRNSFVLGLVGMLVGAGLLAGIFWGAGVIPPKSGGQQQDTSLEGATDAQQYLASQAQRIAELESAIAHNPQDAPAIEELADIYMVGQAWEDAFSWFSRVLEIEPDNPHALLDTGTAYMNLGYFANAEERFARVLTLDLENVQAHYNAGFLFAFRTDAPDLTKAVAHWKEVVRLDPESMLAQVAQIHLDQFQPEGATP